MIEKNKVVIKINYKDSNNLYESNPQPQIITEWNYKRILLALIFILGLLVMGGVLLISALDINETEKPQKIYPKINNKPSIKKINSNASVKLKPELNTLKPINNELTIPSPPLINTLIADPLDNTEALIKSKDNIEKVLSSDEKKETSLVSDIRVSNAVITRGIKNKEPIDKIISPISLNLDEVIEIHYFTEIMDMKDQVLSHHWLWGNQSIYTKKIKIGGDRWRASTSKLIQYSKSGEWTVRLINENNIILNEIKFEIQKTKINI